MDETMKQNITKVVVAVVLFILLLCTITATTKYDKLKNEVDGYKYEISTLEEDKKEKEKLIESYKKTQAEDKETITKLNETITDLEDKVTKKDAQITTLNKQNKELEKNIETLTDEKTTLEKNITDKNNTITLLNDSINDLNSKLNTANDQITTLNTTNTSLNNEVKELQNILNTVNTYYVVNSEVELLSALKKDGNIILNTDIIMSNEVLIKDKYISIDLNGHNLVITNIQLNNTNLEIKDSKSIGKLSIVGDNEDLLKGIKIDNTSTLKITNGNYEGKNLFQVEGTLYVVNGNFDNKQEEIIQKHENSKVEILGGTFII